MKTFVRVFYKRDGETKYVECEIPEFSVITNIVIEDYGLTRTKSIKDLVYGELEL